MFKKIYIVRKLNAENDYKVERVCTWITHAVAGTASHPYAIKLLDNKQDIDNDTLVFAVGGDGTMLEAMRLAHANGATATGLNLGKVGFLTDFTIQDLEEDLDPLIYKPKEYPVENRIALEYHLLDKGEKNTFVPQLAFNEFVISNKYSDQLIKYTLFIGDRCAGVHRANALIVGTPTGSTAYTLSAGGGLLLPSMEAMQIVPVAPISMSSRPIIVPSSEEVRISIETEGEWILKSDGLTIGTFDHLSWIDTQLVISQSNRKIQILHSKYWSYFDMLTQKLGWKST